MILPDVNILIYAHNEDDERFERANAWFQQIMTSASRVCFCWETVNGFVRISTSHKAMPNPLAMKKAFSVVEDWLTSPNALFLEPVTDHFTRLRQIAQNADAKGPLFTDAILATFAITHNATVASTDRDFKVFDGLKLINPLAER